MPAEINYYDWTNFFKEINNAIAKIATEEAREDKLLEIARKTFRSDHAILNYTTIDPFSYIYALAQRNTKNQRQEIFSNAKKVFGIESNIPSDFVFPTPTPNTLSLFYSKGSYINKSGESVGNDCLWRLFLQAIGTDELNEEDFRAVLSLKNVGFTKLSQALFLINPRRFIPFDTQMNSLPIPALGNLAGIVSEVEKKGVSVYLDAIEQLRKSFPGCELFEINLLNVLVNSTESDYLKISNKYCQVSSWADGQGATDFFDDFVKENAVWTGGPTGTTGAKVYPLTDFKKGDVVLVRRGTKRLGGIGIILENQYFPNGFDEDSIIKIAWIAKSNRKIADTGLGQRIGFEEASANTLQKFKELYPESFTVLSLIRNRQKTMINHAAVKYKNLILQGPPGTGKTRLAKQIAEWLTSEDEKQQSLIEAIDKKVFIKEPDIEDNTQVKLIQFHPSYTYEDFVRGIRADAVGEKISYSVENRILTKFAEEAGKPENHSKAYVLIIDEINRANLTTVLGELIYALEYRGKKVATMYQYQESEEISLPHNLYVIGTMNTADRSVSHLDYAIRRRFAFIPVLTDDTVIVGPKAKNVYSVIRSIFNEFTSPEFNQEDIQIGHSYFLCNDGELEMKLKYEIKPLLLEYIRDGVLLDAAKEQVISLHV